MYVAVAGVTASDYQRLVCGRYLGDSVVRRRSARSAHDRDHFQEAVAVFLGFDGTDAVHF